MKRKEISQFLKRDIAKLTNIARKYAPYEVQDEISTTSECIHAGLGDYEESWREECQRLLADEQIEMREGMK